MRQRLGVARCLLTDPELLILDKPLNGLDPAGILRAADDEGAIRVSLSPEAPVDREIATALLRRLLDHGVGVERVAPASTSLEDRFLTMTTTGRSRLALFGARVMGAWAIVLSILATTIAAMGVLSIALADPAPTPEAGTLVAGTAAILVAGALSTARGVGLSALVGSRG